MSVLILAVGTSRAAAVRAAADFLLARGEDVSLLTAEPEPWPAQGLDPRVRVLPLRAGEQRHPAARAGRAVQRLSPALHTKVYAKVYRLVRPYVLWRVTRATVARDLDWTAVRQIVVCDSHAIPIGWHLARRHPKLTVGFELDRAPYPDGAGRAATPDREPVSPAPSRNGIDA